MLEGLGGVLLRHEVLEGGSEVEYPVVVGWEGVMREYVMVYSWFCMAYAGLLLSLYTCSGGSSQGKLGLKLYSI